MRVLIVDDHPLIADAVTRVLRLLHEDAEIEYVSSLSMARSALERASNFDLVLLDLQLGDAMGTDGLCGIVSRLPEVKVVIISAERDPTVIRSCIQCGAFGFIPKTSPAAVLFHALQLVCSGNVYIPPEVLVSSEERSTANCLDSDHRCASTLQALGLTGRQLDVLRLVLRGLSNKSICRELKLAEGTVKVHVSAVLKSLGATTRTQAVVAASRLGLHME